MRLDEIAASIQAEIVAPPSSGAAEATRAFAADRVSDILNAVDGGTLLITNLVGPQLLRLVELMEVPGICLLKNARPDAGFLRAATRQGTVVMASGRGMYETCGRVYELLGEEGPRAK